MKTVSSLLSSFALAALVVKQTNAYSSSFDLTDSTSYLNYYHDAATSFTAEETTLSDSCTVDQVFVMGRHATRYPTSGSYSGIVTVVDRVTEVLSWDNTTMDSSLEFLKTWNVTDLIPDGAADAELLAPLGFNESYAFGEAIRAAYPDLYQAEATVWANNVERVYDTAESWMKGYFGSDYDVSNLIEISATDTTLGANTLNPLATCTGYADNSGTAQTAYNTATNFEADLATYLETLWPGFGWTATESLFMMDLCMYEMDYVSEGNTEFCAIFSDDQWLGYAYYRDLGYWYGSGYGATLGATAGFPYAWAVTQLLNETESTYCQKVFPAFSQDTQMNAMFAGFGIFEDESYPTDAINDTRSYRSSRAVPMGARFVVERQSCDGETYVRLLLNNAVATIPGCSSGPGLMCPLADFVEYMTERKAELGDFSTECGNTATSDFTLFDEPVHNLCTVTSC
ncbi:hypothetical protein BBJ28_00017909 [Nothophytophthora sp. Chile5]|nr:hypothetical protein BBJ28_00017909 [Nothophytophthora sp. Chile5]